LLDTYIYQRKKNNDMCQPDLTAPASQAQKQQVL